MKALVKYGLTDGAVELRQVAEPVLTPDTVLVAPVAVGVCGSDIHHWHNHQSWAVKADMIMGHETAGTIVAVGSNVGAWQVGERVVVETAAQICNKCSYCRSGYYNLCPGRLGYGALADGSMAELVLAEPRTLHRIPDNVSFDQAAMTEPYCVAFNALVERGEVKPGQLVVIQGVGPIGTLCVQLARLRGAGRIIATGTERDQVRLAKALGLGADQVIDVSVQDPWPAVQAAGDGYGADVVVDATGVSAAFAQAMQLVRPLGEIIKVGWGPAPLNASLDPVVGKAVTVHGCFSHRWSTWEAVLSLFASGRLDPQSIIGGAYPLEEWKQAFADMESGQNIKSVLEITE